MDKVKKFFAKKKAEAKFSKAGPGRKLTDSGPSNSQSKRPQDAYVPIKRDDLTDEMKKARDAALERMNSNKPLDFSLKAIREQARREIEEEKNKVKEEGSSSSSISKLKLSDAKEQYTVEGAFFTCPLISDEILPKQEWRKRIKDFLYEQLALNNSNCDDELDPGLTSCLIIKNCNTLDRAEDCIETIKKYLSNIIQNPTETKFHKIRMSNRIFSEKVSNVEGSFEFMKAAGFQEQIIDDESFLVWSPEYKVEALVKLTESLDQCEVIQLELDRNVKVLYPSQAQSISLPPDFFKVTLDELKREQTQRTLVLEDSLVLKTKAMREKEQDRYVNKFKYSLIRIRFPDGLYLQGTFSVYEKLSNVYLFVSESLHHEGAEFSLISPDGIKFSNEENEKTLAALRLVPNCILKFTYEGESKGFNEYLKENLLMLVETL